MRIESAARRQRVANVSDIFLGMLAQVSGKPCAGCIERRGGLGGNDCHMHIFCCRAGDLLWRLLDNDLCIGAANTERADAGTPRSLTRPLCQFGRNIERRICEIYFWVWFLEMEIWWNLAS